MFVLMIMIMIVMSLVGTRLKRPLKRKSKDERYKVAENIGLWNESLYVEIEFLSACYDGYRLFSSQKFLSFALLKHSPCRDPS